LALDLRVLDHHPLVITMKRLAVFSAAVAALLLTAAAIWLVSDGPDLPASSGSLPGSFVAPLPTGKRVCIPNQIIPPGASIAEMTISTYGRPVAAAVSVDGVFGGRTVLRGAKRFREAQNVEVPIAPSSSVERVVNLCIRNVGRSKLQLAGTADGGPSVRFPNATKFTWAETAGAIASRFQVARVAPFGAITVWFALALALVGAAVGVGAIFMTVRDR